ncbi:MAG: hypothetical protein LW824_08595 [Algoriphagus sp.]|nr:hypothetical protein [Algoriphagus sp.]
MKTTLAFLVSIFLLTQLTAGAQDLEKMNKNELRDFSLLLQGKIDSLNTQINSLQETGKLLSASLASSEEKNTSNISEIQKLNNLIVKTQKELERVQTEKEAAITTLNKDVLLLKDSISTLQQAFLSAASGTPNDPNDFLNSYFKKPFPLENNSFSLVLSKVVFGTSNSSDSDYYNQENQVKSLPEILPAEAVTYWGVKPKVKIINGTEFNDFVVAQPLAYYNARLPKIQIYKNKLLTVVNQDSSEESFLFTVNGLDSENRNNQRGIIQFNLVSEESSTDEEYDRPKNLTWRFFAIENEVYLALNYTQLSRINSELQEVGKIEAYSEYYERVVMASDYDSDYRQTTTGKGVYLSRKQDNFMQESLYIDPSDLIFLFKLK